MLHLESGNLARLTKSDIENDVFRSSTATALMGGSMHVLFQRNTRLNIQGTDTFWGVELVASNIDEVDIQLGHVHFNFSYAL
jgi:hypothetical protein